MKPYCNKKINKLVYELSDVEEVVVVVAVGRLLQNKNIGAILYCYCCCANLKNAIERY
jgi:hypothetical protein